VGADLDAFDVDAIDLAALRGRLSAKYQYYPDDVIPAWVAEMDFPLAEPVARSLHAAIDRSDTGYRFGGQLPEALADFARERWTWEINPRHVTLVPDVLTGIAAVLRVFAHSGEAVVVTTPVYNPFFSVVRDVAGLELVDAPLVRTAAGEYELDLAVLEAAFARPDVTAYLMSSPHNPTGTVPSRQTLLEIHRLAERHGVLVIADEIHAPLALPGAEHVPYLSVVPDDANAVALVSASKAWNLAGLKCGQLVGTDRTARRIGAELPFEISMTTSHLGVIASEAAYRDGGPWLDFVVGILDGNRAELARLIAAELPEAGYVPPAASYLAWIDLSAYGVGDDPAPGILEKGRVGLSPGIQYGPGGAGFVRLNMGTSPAILEQIVRGMARAVRS
jgi:cystathionine beta-lyase